VAQVDAPYYSVLQSEFATALRAKEPATMSFFLAFPSGNIVDLQGYHWSLELTFNFK
jgi:hypothetical protein